MLTIAQMALLKKWKSTSPSKPKFTSRVRTCYNCGNQKHFIADLPYERVEDHNERLVCKDMKSKSCPPSDSDKKITIPHRAMTTQEEYPSVMMQVMVKK
jgi:hypothetical protein